MDERDTSTEKTLEHWTRFYANKHTMKPTPFAKFARKRMKGETVVDLGCGNGRDTYYLGKKFQAIGIDNAIQPAIEGFILDDVENFPEGADNYYARFLFHAIPLDKENNILKGIHGTLYAETRAEGDDSFVDDHYRRLSNPNNFLKKLINFGYEIEYFEVGKNLAKYKDQNPLVFRVIASRP